jgi:hypothetical protein
MTALLGFSEELRERINAAARTRSAAAVRKAIDGVDIAAYLRACPDSDIDDALWYDVRDQHAEGVPDFHDDPLVAAFADAIDEEAERRQALRPTAPLMSGPSSLSSLSDELRALYPPPGVKGKPHA